MLQRVPARLGDGAVVGIAGQRARRDRTVLVARIVVGADQNMAAAIARQVEDEIANMIAVLAVGRDRVIESFVEAPMGRIDVDIDLGDVAALEVVL